MLEAKSSVIAFLLFVTAFVPSTSVEGQTRVANTSLSFPTQLGTQGYAFENALGRLVFRHPVAMATPPGETNRLFVVEKGGTIQVIPNLADPTMEPFFSLRVASTGESGLLGLAFHPDYATNGFFFVSYSFIGDGSRQQRIARFQVSANPNRADMDSEWPLITQEDPASNHNGGDLHFGPDGYLYASVGDGGGADDVYDHGRFVDRGFFSAILRLDVDRRPGSLLPNPSPSVHAGSYTIPPDNPLLGITSYMGYPVDPDALRTEIWAAGFRNPWRFSFDGPTGRLLCGDVGQRQQEEIILVEPGRHYGWSFKEGNLDFADGPGGNEVPENFNPSPPLYAYGRVEGSSVTGGLVYRGNRLSELEGRYLFADYARNHLWALTIDANDSVQSVDKLSDAAPDIVAFGVDPRNGDVLLASYHFAEGEILRLVRGEVQDDSLPAKLSESGAFSDLETLTPEPGIVPYAINHPHWTDGAVMQRWFSIPNVEDDMTFHIASPWEFPTGQIWIKHFELDLTPDISADPHWRVETRVLVKTEEGVYGVTYRWNEAQTDADLVRAEGATQTFEIATSTGTMTQEWRYLARSACLSCHQASAGHVLGFDTAQVNRSGGSGGAHQLEEWDAMGYFANGIADVHPLPRLAGRDDEGESLEHRARSYLASNCAPCHRPGGSAPGLFDLRWDPLTSETGIVSGALIQNFGDPQMRVAVPGDPSHSMLVQRLDDLDPSRRMPPLGSMKIDAEGVALLRAWIQEEMPSHQSYASWRLEHGLESDGVDQDGDGAGDYYEFLTKTNPVNGGAPWDAETVVRGEMLELSYESIVGRAVVVELSMDARTWIPWNDPANQQRFPRVSTPIHLEIPLGGAPRLFARVRVLER